MSSTPQLLQGKTAAITGGLTGIGRAIALGYLNHGANVAINYLGSPKDEALLEELKKDVGDNASQFLAVAGDISLPETGQKLVEEAVKAWGRLDVFVSNAGVCQFAEFLTYASGPYYVNLAVQEPIDYILVSPPTSFPLPSVQTSTVPSTPLKPPLDRCPRNRLQAVAS